MCSHVQRRKLTSVYSSPVSVATSFSQFLMNTSDPLTNRQNCCTHHFQLCHSDHKTLLSAPSIAFLFITSHPCNLPSLSSPPCSACPKSHPKLTESISPLWLTSMAWSPSTIILNMLFFMCPFSFGTGSPKIPTKPFHFFLGLSFSLVLKKVESVSGR